MDDRLRHQFRQTWHLHLREVLLPVKTPPPAPRNLLQKKIKRPRGFAALGTKTFGAVSLLRRRSRGLRSGWSRPWSRGLGAGTGAGGRRYPSLRVVSLDDGLGNVERRRVKHRAVRPRRGRVDHDSQIVLLDVLDEHRLHFLEEALFDLLLLSIEIFLRVLGVALELLLLLIDLPLQFALLFVSHASRGLLLFQCIDSALLGG